MKCLISFWNQGKNLLSVETLEFHITIGTDTCAIVYITDSVCLSVSGVNINL